MAPCEGGRLKSPPFFLYAFLPIVIYTLLITHKAFAQGPISGFNPANLLEMSDGVVVNANTFWADNALPLRAIFFDKGLEGPFRPDNKNTLDVFWKTDIGIIYHGWRIAGFYRGELFMKANRDTVEMLRMINLKQELPIGRRFDIELMAEGFSATGIELSRGFRVGKGLSAGFTARYIKGEGIQEGTFRGSAIPATAKTYDFDFNLDYIYDKNYLYKRRDLNKGYGDGYSFDLGLKYDFNDSLSTEVLFRDILGRIYWKDMPYTTAAATSATKYYDEDGYMAFRPTISGYEGYKDFTQRIPLKTDVSIIYKKDPFTISPTVNFIKGRPLYWIDLGYKASEDLSFDISYNANYESLSIGTAYKKAMLKIYANDINLNRAMAVGLTLLLKYEW